MPAHEPRSRRRGIASLLPPVVLTLGVLHATSSPAAAAAWRQPAFAASRSSFNPRETAIDAGSVATLVERWRVAGVGAEGSPVVAGGRVFVANGDEVVALGLDDGAELWREAIDDGYDCCGVWEPVLTPDGKITAEFGWDFGGGVARFDPATGANTYVAWFHGSTINRAVRGGEVFAIEYGFGSGGPIFIQLEPYPGLIFFGGLFPVPALAGPAVQGERAFVGVGSTVNAYDLTSCPDATGIPTLGKFCGPAWTATLPAAPKTPVAFRGKVVLAAGDGTLQVRAAADGALEWSATVGAGIAHAPAVARKRIFVATKRGILVAFDSRGCGSATCPAVERFRTGSPATGPPVVAGNVLYAGTKNGRIVAFPAAGCAQAACDPLLDVDLGGGAIVAGPIVVDGTVIAGTADGQLVALGLPAPG